MSGRKTKRKNVKVKGGGKRNAISALGSNSYGRENPQCDLKNLKRPWLEMASSKNVLPQIL